MKKFIERTIHKKLIGDIDKNYVSILIGPRQVGKTTLLRHIEGEIQGKTVFLDMDDPRDAIVFRGGIESFLQHVKEEQQVVFLDEFHRIDNITKILKVVRDHYLQIKIYASGSSSVDIHKHLKESAVGRVRQRRIYPLTFTEFLQTKNIGSLALKPEEKLSVKEIRMLNIWLDEFILWGGMPEISQTDDIEEKREILYDIVKLYLEKDIRTLIKEKQMIKFNLLLKMLALQIGSMLNKASLARDTALSFRHLDACLEILAHTFVFETIAADYSNPTKRLVRSPKIYCYDTGVRNALVEDFRFLSLRPDRGPLVENYVFNEMQKSIRLGTKICFHRTVDGQEVDFILEHDHQKIAIEVKCGKEVTPSRAIKDMLQADDVLCAVILNRETHLSQEHNGKMIHFLPLFFAAHVGTLFLKT